jgi:uncharacterized membrane protein
MFDEQETSTASSETESFLFLEEPQVQERTANVQVIQRITSYHSTPLPDAEALSAYAKLIPNGADRIMSLVEREATHRHQHESAETLQVVRGHWMAFTLTLALSSGGVCLGLLGHDWLAAVLCTTTIGAVITTLVVDSRSRGKAERSSDPASPTSPVEPRSN